MPSLTLEAIAAEATPVTDQFESAGHQLYLVGGIVRDLILRRDVSADADLDITTDATPDQIKRLIGPLADALWLQGERFGTIGALIGGREYEITTHRQEVYVADSRKPAVSFSTAIDEDLSRRDFTVNAMAIALPSRELVDPFHGRDDLDERRLRTPLDAEVSFMDDPLRMLRAARFTAGYDLTPSVDVQDAMVSLGSRLDIVSTERVRDELDKLLGVPAPSTGLELLAETGLLERFLPELAGLEPSARTELFGRVDAATAETQLRLAILLSGVDVGAVKKRLRTLRYSNAARKQVATILEGAADLASGAIDSSPALRRWVARVGDLREAARTVATITAPESTAAVERSRELERLLGSELDDLLPALTGEAVMAALGIGQGLDVGRAMAFLQDLRFDEGPLEESEALERLRDWWDSRDART